MKIVEELPDQNTYVYGHVADLDVEGTYPNGECVANISKETTVREMVEIRGVDHMTQRAVGVNMTGGHVNAVENCCNVLSAPTMDELLFAFRETLPKTRANPQLIQALSREVSHGELVGFDLPEDVVTTPLELLPDPVLIAIEDHPEVDVFGSNWT